MTRKFKLQKMLFLFFATITVNVASLFAQDVIILKNGEEINALVYEIGDVDVKYKKFDDPNGLNYMLKKTEIFMIRYANGSKDVFTDAAPSVPIPTQQSDIQQRRVQNQPGPALDYAAFTRLRANDNAMAAFLRENDDDLYKLFHKGVSLRRKGKGFLGAGLGVTGASIALMVAGLTLDNNNDDTGLVMFTIGNYGLYAGEALIIASIPLSAVGGSLKKRAANGYEKKYFGYKASSQPSLNFIFAGNGVGLALRF